jgi:hypothetical protein
LFQSIFDLKNEGLGYIIYVGSVQSHYYQSKPKFSNSLPYLSPLRAVERIHVTSLFLSYLSPLRAVRRIHMTCLFVSWGMKDISQPPRIHRIVLSQLPEFWFQSDVMFRVFLIQIIVHSVGPRHMRLGLLDFFVPLRRLFEEFI